MAHKILLDTDLGNNPDDAVCLAYLLARPDCDLLGITTVTGRAVERAMLCSALCLVAAREVPIYPGAETPLIVLPRQEQCPQAAALPRWPHETNFPRGEAVTFLRDTIRQHPGEITLLAIGPLTNVALLFALDPDIPALLKGLVMMAGRFFHRTPGAGLCETNALGDPHAAAMVYHAPVPRHRSVGLDVTRRLSLPMADVRRRFTHPLLRPVLDFAEAAGDPRETLTFNDPLAAAVIFEEDLCTFVRGRVEPELTSPRLMGLTHFEPGTPGAAHDVAENVNPDRFLEHIAGVLA